MINKHKPITYYAQNRDRVLAYQRNVQRPLIRVARSKALLILGSKCIKCGFDDPRALHIDHINGGGCLEQRKLGTGVAYLEQVYLSVKRNEGKYQLLCANCNMIKKFDKKEFSGSSKRRLNTELKERSLFD